MLQTNGPTLPDELTQAVRDPGEFSRVLLKYHAADVAEAVNRQPLATAIAVIALLPLDAAVHLFDQPHLERAAALIEGSDHERAAGLIEKISADRRADMFRKLPPAAHQWCLAKLDPATRQGVEQVLAYPPHTAGGIMTTEFVSVPETTTVGQALQLIHATGDEKETVYVIYLTDPVTKQLTHKSAESSGFNSCFFQPAPN